MTLEKAILLAMIEASYKDHLIDEETYNNMVHSIWFKKRRWENTQRLFFWQNTTISLSFLVDSKNWYGIIVV